MFTCPWFKVEMHSLEKSVIPYSIILIHSHLCFSRGPWSKVTSSRTTLKKLRRSLWLSGVQRFRFRTVGQHHLWLELSVNDFILFPQWFNPSFSPVTSSGYDHSNTIFGGMKGGWTSMSIPVDVHQGSLCLLWLDFSAPSDDVRLDELSKSMDGRLLELEKSRRAAVPWLGWIGIGIGIRWTMVIMVHPLLMFDDIRNIYI